MPYSVKSEIAGSKRIPGDFFVTPESHTPGLRMQGLGERFLSPTLHTWLSRDPIREHQSYCFVGNTPIGVWDYLSLADGKADENCCTCAGPLKKLMEQEPFRSKLDDLKKRKCIIADPLCVACDHCGMYTDEKKYKGGIKEEGYIIAICTKRDSDDLVCPGCDVLKETLRHEMQHAHNQCGKSPCKPKDSTLDCCARWLCDEMHAYFCGARRKWDSWDELAERALASVNTWPYCTDWGDFRIKEQARLYCSSPANKTLPWEEQDCFVPFPPPADPKNPVLKQR